MAAVCQPLAASPLKMLRAAEASSVSKGCGERRREGLDAGAVNTHPPRAIDLSDGIVFEIVLHRQPPRLCLDDITLEPGQIAVQHRNDLSALTDSGGDTFHRACANIADSKNAFLTGF